MLKLRQMSVKFRLILIRIGAKNVDLGQQVAKRVQIIIHERLKVQQTQPKTQTQPKIITNVRKVIRSV